MQAEELFRDALRQRIATHCNTLQHTATHCNTLQAEELFRDALRQDGKHTAALCNYAKMLQQLKRDYAGMCVCGCVRE